MDIGLQFGNGGADKPEVCLPASKSISNRVLLINALSGSGMPVKNLSDCDDTAVMEKILNAEDCRFDVGHAGTAMRFLTAFLSKTVGKWEITGSERMQRRPVAVLVDALNHLGACIEYIGREGFPPLRIYGAFLRGGELEVAASVSSQYISALLMIAPYMEKGLKLILKGDVVSFAYIRMTVELMREFGAQIRMSEREIEVAPEPYRPVAYEIEPDWSAASYFYEWLAIAGKGGICLTGLKEKSIQGDAGQVKVWEKLGVHTTFKEGKAVLDYRGKTTDRLVYDFKEMPDLVQSFVVACCMTDCHFEFTGVETLRIKETDRITALVTELAKLGYCLGVTGEGRLSWSGERCPVRNAVIDTYQDHRMAMAFAPAVLNYPGIIIREAGVVTKSFPDFWEQLKQLGVKREVRGRE